MTILETVVREIARVVGCSGTTTGKVVNEVARYVCLANDRKHHLDRIRETLTEDA